MGLGASGVGPSCHNRVRFFQLEPEDTGRTGPRGEQVLVRMRPSLLDAGRRRDSPAGG